MTVVSDLRRLNDRWSSDNAPLWADALGVALSLGFFVRSQIHVLAALGAGLDPSLDDYDVRAASPVIAIQDNRLVDLSARLGSTAILVVGWAVLAGQADGDPRLAQIYLLANGMVLAADPFLFIIAMRHNRPEKEPRHSVENRGHVEGDS
jgi:hypothetical protein